MFLRRSYVVGTSRCDVRGPRRSRRFIVQSLGALVSNINGSHFEQRGGIRAAVRHAFTLIELMVVIGILAIILTVSIPAVYRYFHPNTMQKALDEILGACRDARELAVLQTKTTALVISAADKSISVRGASAPKPQASSEYPELSAMATPSQPSAPLPATKSCQIPDKIEIELLDINGLDFMGAEQIEVRFYPKGTSDNLKLILRSFADGSNDRRLIFLDPITGHADYEVDPNKFEQHKY